MKRICVMFTAVVMIVLTIVNKGEMVYAAEGSEDDSSIAISIDSDDEALSDATVVSSFERVENGRRITEITYRQPDGTVIIDVLDVNANPSRSGSGSDSATRTRTVKGWGTVTITAYFDWYTEGIFSYVRCSSMGAYRSLRSGVVVDIWETSRTSNYVAVGTAKAEVHYGFYDLTVPALAQSGTFRITCTDGGTISDNGDA